MDATIYVQRIRQQLEDEPENSRKKGYFWTDDDILTALNLSLDAVVQFLAKKQAQYLLQKLFSNVEAMGSVNLPDDYFYHVAGSVKTTVDAEKFQPARLFLCGIGMVNWNAAFRAVHIKSLSVYFRKNNGFASGRLTYIKKPSRFALTGAVASEPEDLPKAVYDVVLAHATAVLAIRQEPTARYLANFSKAMQFLVSDSATQLPYNLQENTSV